MHVCHKALSHVLGHRVAVRQAHFLQDSLSLRATCGCLQDSLFKFTRKTLAVMGGIDTPAQGPVQLFRAMFVSE